VIPRSDGLAEAVDTVAHTLRIAFFFPPDQYPISWSVSRFVVGLPNGRADLKLLRYPNCRPWPSRVTRLLVFIDPPRRPYVFEGIQAVSTW